MNWWAALLLAAGITRLWADVDATSLLVRVRSRVLDSARTYRDRFADRTSSARPSLLSKKQPRGCWTLPGPLFSDSSDSGVALGLKSQMPGLSLISSDRAKLDVMVSGAPQRRRSPVGEGPTQGGCWLNLVAGERPSRVTGQGGASRQSLRMVGEQLCRP